MNAKSMIKKRVKKTAKFMRYIDENWFEVATCLILIIAAILIVGTIL